MDNAIKIEASLACANFRYLERDIRELEKCSIDFLHIDIMDGLFVPNFCLDFSITKTVTEISAIPIECHLMVTKPERYLETVAALKPVYISIHWEATPHVQKALKQIRDLGCKPAIALNPATSLSSLEYILDDIDMINIMTVNPGFAGQKLVPACIKKIADAREMIEKRGFDHIEIQVDGNVSFENIPAMVQAGATMLVGGTSSIFRKGYTITESVEQLRQLITTVHQKQNNN